MPFFCSESGVSSFWFLKQARYRLSVQDRVAQFDCCNRGLSDRFTLRPLLHKEGCFGAAADLHDSPDWRNFILGIQPNCAMCIVTNTHEPLQKRHPPIGI